MSITEKELAEKLAGIYGDINDYDWPTVARTAAELLGVTLTPEKPEPGTVWASPDGGFYLRIIEQPEGHDAWFIEDGRVLRSYSTPWQDLTPARVISEDEWAELTTKAESQADEIQLLRQSRDKWAELARKAEQEAKAVARRKMGAKAEVTRAQVMDAYTDGTLAVSHADTRAIDRIMELLAASK